MEQIKEGTLGLLSPRVVYSRLERVLQLCADNIENDFAREIAAEIIACREGEAKQKLLEMGFKKDWREDGTDGK